MVSPIARPPDGRVVEPVLLKQERSRRYPHDLFRTWSRGVSKQVATETYRLLAGVVNVSISALKTSWFIVSLVFFMGIATASHAQATKPAPPTPIDDKKVELGGTPWNPQWDKIIEKALPPEMLSSRVPSRVRRFCPRFYEMAETDKRAFWAYFFQALAGAEVGLNPNTSVRHAKPEGATAMRSEGLLQLTYEDQKRYGCDFNWETDRKLKANDPAKTILQPKNNLECGVTILDKQIIDSHKPLLWRSGYWSTLRPGGESYRVFAKQMTNVPAACGVGVAKGKKRTGQDGVTTEQLAATR